MIVHKQRDINTFILKEHAGFTYLVAFSLFTLCLVFYIQSPLFGYLSMALPISYLLFTSRMYLVIDKYKGEITYTKKRPILSKTMKLKAGSVDHIESLTMRSTGGSRGIYWPVNKVRISLVLKDGTEVKIYPSNFVENTKSNEGAAAQVLSEFLGVPVVEKDAHHDYYDKISPL